MVHRFPAPVEAHAGDCAYVAARDYCVARKFVDDDGEPLVHLDGSPIASRVDEEE